MEEEIKRAFHILHHHGNLLPLEMQDNKTNSENVWQLQSLTFPKCPRPSTLMHLKFFMFIVDDTGEVILGLVTRKIFEISTRMF